MSLTGRANFTYSNNKLLEYEQSGIKYPYQAWKGTPWGTQRGLVALGLFKDQADIDSSPKQTFVTSVMPGDIKYKDINGDGKLTVTMKYLSATPMFHVCNTVSVWNSIGKD